MVEGYFHKKLDRILGKEKDKNLKIPSRCRVIAATSRKGGTGKTITTVTLAAVYAEMGFRVLVIDLDDSGDATANLGGDRIEWQYTISDVFENTVTINNSIVATDLFGSSDGCIHLIGSDLRNQIYASQHSADNGKKVLLQQEINKLRDRFDFILLDSPPTMGFFNFATIFAADYIITPIDPGPQDLRSFATLIETVNQATYVNPNLIHLGCFITKPVRSTKMYKEVTELLNSYGNLFKTEIPNDIKLREAFADGRPITKFMPKSNGAKAYRQLAEEVIEKCLKSETTQQNQA